MSNPEQTPELSTNPSVIEAVPGANLSAAQDVGELAVPAVIDTVPGVTTSAVSNVPSRGVMVVSPRPGDPGYEDRVADYLATHTQQQNLAMQKAATRKN